MAGRTIEVPGVGSVTITKNARARRLRLRLSPNGEVLVTIPRLAPYQAAVSFIEQHRDWILKRRIAPVLLGHGDRIGISHRLEFVSARGTVITARVSNGRVSVGVPTGRLIEDADVQAKAAQAARQALRVETRERLVPRLHQLAERLGYQISGVSVKDMTTRWGSCSSAKRINLSIYLAQLPADLVDYILIHELTHTEIPNHSAAFWARVRLHLPEYEAARKRLRGQSPALRPNTPEE